mmetsp:Transcript_43886/g.93352  ORF Transcript_43886/g.93352 Transcript_43886/m.93352 type:complete len:102 (+) Transcript_43886:3703-4008(+)
MNVKGIQFYVITNLRTHGSGIPNEWFTTTKWQSTKKPHACKRLHVVDIEPSEIIGAINGIDTWLIRSNDNSLHENSPYHHDSNTGNHDERKGSDYGKESIP